MADECYAEAAHRAGALSREATQSDIMALLPERFSELSSHVKTLQVAIAVPPSVSLCEAILVLQPHLNERLRLRDAVAIESRNPESRLAAAPRDIVRYVILPYIPDLRRGGNWMQRKLARVATREADFLQHYGATNSFGELQYDDATPMLEGTVLEDLISMDGIQTDCSIFGKFIDDAFVMCSHNILRIQSDRELNPIAPCGDYISGCSHVGSNLLQMEHTENRTSPGARMISHSIVILPNAEVVPCIKIHAMHILPCGLVLVLEPMGLYNPRSNTYIRVTYDVNMHYDDFGCPTSMPHCPFYDPFDPAFGEFLIV